MNALSAIVEHSPYIGLFVLLILGGIGFPFPEDATLILCGFLMAQQVIEPVRALVVVYGGLLIADSILYGVGRKYGRMVVTHPRFQRIVSPGKLAVIEEKFNRRGVLFILLGRHMVGLRAQIFLAAGVMKISFVKFLFADAVSAIFTMALMVGAGYAGGNSLEIIRKDISRIEHVVILLLVIVLVIYLFFKILKQREKR